MSDPTAPRPPPIGMLALLLLGCLLYAATIGSISDLGSTDAAGRGLGEAFGVIYGFFLWIVLAAMVVIGGINGRMPAWGGIAASILVPASAVASVIATQFIEYHTGWQLLVPALIPPLRELLRQPSFRLYPASSSCADSVAAAWAKSLKSSIKNSAKASR